MRSLDPHKVCVMSEEAAILLVAFVLYEGLPGLGGHVLKFAYPVFEVLHPTFPDQSISAACELNSKRWHSSSPPLYVRDMDVVRAYFSSRPKDPSNFAYMVAYLTQCGRGER